MTTLNLDVLHQICSHLTAVEDVLSFSRTRSEFHPIAVERRLSMRPVVIYCGNSIRKLHDFVFVDKERRGPHIRAICIPGPWADISNETLSEDLVERFLELLSCATGLRKITLYVPVKPSPLFTAHPTVLPAIAGLASLQELVLTAPIEVATMLLGSTCSSLRVFRYQSPDAYKGSGSSESLSIRVPSQLASTLEEIQAPGDFFAIAARSQVSFPAARSVTFSGRNADYSAVFRWRMDVLLALFPNLDRTLITCIGNPHVIYHVLNDSYGTNEDLLALRGRNRGAQKTRTWKGLDRVAVQDIDGLYALGLSCPIRHLTLKPAFTCQDKGHGSPAQQYYTNAPAVLQDCTPSHVVLSHNLCPVHGSLSISNWNTLFTDSVVEGLTHLVLSVDYQTFVREPSPPVGEEEMERRWQVTLDSLISGLEPLRRLTHIRIIMFVHILYLAMPLDGLSAAIHDGLSSFKFDRILDMLPSRIPSLSYIAITSRGTTCKPPSPIDPTVYEHWDVNRAWRVGRRPHDSPSPSADGGKHHLEELSETEIETVDNTEDLYPTLERGEWGRDPGIYGIDEDRDIREVDSETEGDSLDFE